MRTDWVSPSAATLVVGAFALVLGTMLSPTDGAENANQALRVVNQNDGRMLGMAVFYFLASLGLMLGMPAVLSVVARRGWRLGVSGVMVFSVGVLGTAGFAMLLVFFKALAGAEAIELHTGEYADTRGAEREEQLARISRAAALGRSLGLAVHAGHGLTYLNVAPVAAVEEIEELNIGHSIVSHAILVGLERAVREMVDVVRRARGGA